MSASDSSHSELPSNVNSVGLSSSTTNVGIVAQNNQYRVKLYQLDSNGQWFDLGTGYVIAHHVPTSDLNPLSLTGGDTLVLTVRSDENDALLVEHRVDSENEYDRQGETIFTWQESESECALSFQDAEGCAEVWEQVLQFQGKREDELLAGSEFPDPETQALLDLGAGVPLPEAATLEALRQRLRTITPATKDVMVSAVLRRDFMNRLYDLFATAEDLEEMKALHTIFDIFVGIVLLNEAVVFDVLLNDDNLARSIACFEYDPDLPENSDFHRHRKFLSKSLFKEVVPIKDHTILARIHQNYRLNYLKDAVLLRQLDEVTVGTLNHTIFFNNMAIVSALAQDEDFLRDLFTAMLRLPSGENEVDTLTSEPSKHWLERKDAFLFLQELCSLAKNLQYSTRENFYRTLVNHSMLQVLDLAMVSTSPAPNAELWMWIIIADLLLTLLQFDPKLVRGYLYGRAADCMSSAAAYASMASDSNAHPPSMLSCIVDVVSGQLGCELDIGLMHQFAEILRLVLETEPGVGANNSSVGHDKNSSSAAMISFALSDRETFMKYFFDHHLSSLVQAVSRQPISRSKLASVLGSSSSRASSSSTPQQDAVISTISNAVDQAAKFHCCELLTTLIIEHPQSIRPFFVRFKFLDAIVLLMTPDSSGGDSQEPAKKIRLKSASSASLITATLKIPNPQLTLRAIRFIRACLSGETAIPVMGSTPASSSSAPISTVTSWSDDAFFTKRVENHPRVLDALMNLFFLNGARYNLINSAILEVVELIRSRNLKPLVTALVTKFSDRFKSIQYVQLFQQLQLRHEQNLDAEVEAERAKNGTGTAVDLNAGLLLPNDRARRFGRDDDEDSYFSSIDDDLEQPRSPKVAQLSPNGKHVAFNATAHAHSPTSSSSSANLMSNLFPRPPSPPSPSSSNRFVQSPPTRPLSPPNLLSPPKRSSAAGNNLGAHHRSTTPPLSPPAASQTLSPNSSGDRTLSPTALRPASSSAEFIDRLSFLASRGIKKDDDDDDLLALLARRKSGAVSPNASSSLPVSSSISSPPSSSTSKSPNSTGNTIAFSFKSATASSSNPGQALKRTLPAGASAASNQHRLQSVLSQRQVRSTSLPSSSASSSSTSSPSKLVDYGDDEDEDDNIVSSAPPRTHSLPSSFAATMTAASSSFDSPAIRLQAQPMLMPSHFVSNHDDPRQSAPTPSPPVLSASASPEASPPHDSDHHREQGNDDSDSNNSSKRRKLGSETSLDSSVSSR